MRERRRIDISYGEWRFERCAKGRSKHEQKGAPFVISAAIASPCGPSRRCMGSSAPREIAQMVVSGRR